MLLFYKHFQVIGLFARKFHKRTVDIYKHQKSYFSTSNSGKVMLFLTDQGKVALLLQGTNELIFKHIKDLHIQKENILEPEAGINHQPVLLRVALK